MLALASYRKSRLYLGPFLVPVAFATAGITAGAVVLMIIFDVPAVIVDTVVTGITVEVYVVVEGTFASGDTIALLISSLLASPIARPACSLLEKETLH